MRKWRSRVVATTVALLGLSIAVAGCSSGSGASESNKTDGVTITVALASSPPPAAALAAFTKQTGITVKWSNVDWDSLQTKIAAAGTAKTYFADVTDVDWSRVGELGKLGWFAPLEKYLDVPKLKSAMPQLSSFQLSGKTYGIPNDASFTDTVVNKDMFAKAGITQMPTTLSEYTDDLTQVKAKGVVSAPLSIPFAAAEGLSTYWYQVTAAYGGTVLDAKGAPTFASPSSAGYKAAEWMVKAYQDGLVPAGNINVTDSQSEQLLAHGTVASIFSDYSGTVGSLYDVPDSSTVVGQIEYLPIPGVDGPAPSLNDPDAVGIPIQSKHPVAAAKFIEWMTSAENQADFSGANGPDKVWQGSNTPSRLSVVLQLNAAGKLAGGSTLTSILKGGTRAVFPDGEPTWYPEFSRAVYTNLHAAAVGDETVATAIKTIADTTERLNKG